MSKKNLTAAELEQILSKYDSDNLSDSQYTQLQLMCAKLGVNGTTGPRMLRAITKKLESMDDDDPTGYAKPMISVKGSSAGSKSTSRPKVTVHNKRRDEDDDEDYDRRDRRPDSRRSENKPLDENAIAEKAAKSVIESLKQAGIIKPQEDPAVARLRLELEEERRKNAEANKLLKAAEEAEETEDPEDDKSVAQKIREFLNRDALVDLGLKKSKTDEKKSKKH